MKRSKKIRFPFLLNSKWTSHEPVEGWRHFQVLDREERAGRTYALIQSVVDPKVRLWIQAKALYNLNIWQAGWITTQEDGPCGGSFD